MYFFRYCILLIIFTLVFYILTIKSHIENFSQIQEINKNNIMKLKGKLFKNYKIKSKVCKENLSPSPTPSISPTPPDNMKCTYDKELNTINPCLNEHCKTFRC